MKRLSLLGISICCLIGVGRAEILEPIKPLPSAPSMISKAALLGKRLFHDPILSRNGKISCASCHDITSGGDDGKARSIGIDGALGDINSPTVLNSSLNFRQFWDGRARTLEEQIDGPINHPKEMGASWRDVVKKLRSHNEYSVRFAKIFEDGVTPTNIRIAIAAFEKALLTPNSKFDLYLKGNREALSPLELAGYKKFKAYGCISCHQGQNVGGNLFQTMGVMGDYFKDRGGAVTKADMGRYNVTQNPLDKYLFKVPGLRNVALTAPYFHDGSAKVLEVAVAKMAWYQLGRRLDSEDVSQIVAFLNTLTGEVPKIMEIKDEE